MYDITIVDKKFKELMENDTFTEELENLRARKDELFDSLSKILNEIFTEQGKLFKVPTNIKFNPVANNIYARAVKDNEENLFKIQIGDNFLLKLLIYSDSIVEDFLKHSVKSEVFSEEKFEQVKQIEISNMLFKIWVLVLAYHEFGHIELGHIEYLIDKKFINIDNGIAEYLEFSDSEVSETEIWHEIENEADTFSIKNAFLHFMGHNFMGHKLEDKNLISEIIKFQNIYRLENKKEENNWKDIKIFSMSISLFFIYCQEIAKNRNDKKHPIPEFRINQISATSISQSDDKAKSIIIYTFLNSHFEMNELLGILQDKKEYYLSLDFTESVLKTIMYRKVLLEGIEEFRKK